MKNPLTIVLFLLVTISHISAQSPVLVEDYIPGPQGSVDGRIYEFDNTLIYLGTNQNGEKAILQYDKASDQVVSLLTNEDVEGEIDVFFVSFDRAIIYTEVEGVTKNLYLSRMSDFSDLTKIYDAENARITILRLSEDYLVVFEQISVNNEDRTNVKLITSSNEVIPLFEGLTGDPFDFTHTIVEDHFIFAPEENLIDGEAIFTYNIESGEFVPFTNISPEYVECGLFTRIYSAADRILYYECEEKIIYDLINEIYVEAPEEDFSFIQYDTDTHLYLNLDNNLYKIDKFNNTKEIILENIRISRGFFSHFIALTTNATNENNIDIVYMNYEDEVIHTFPTDFDTDDNHRLTGFGVVPSGIHTVVYEFVEDNGVIIRIDSDSFVEIDSVYNVNALNRPVAYEEDIYFSHQDPNVGDELFFIDYIANSTIDLIEASRIKIFPNPAQNFIKVEHPEDFTPLSSSIFDINGVIVRKNILQENIDIRNFASGIYLFNTTYSNGKTITQRFVID